ncbi:MAG: tetratricopeptide repeat protein [Chromatiales bacterium]|jgi:TPR repeat protein|nr:tetratricopeptide repeat protein [Chromatiales bacterium]MDX9766196.1 tetratricopeptide repeat protein [Ectothiorhodospiraceae bacterium]
MTRRGWPLLALLAVVVLNTGCDDSTRRYNEALRQQLAGNMVGTVSELTRLAEAGHAGAQFRLAVMYGSGRGAPRDDRRALHWVQQAAAQGHVGGEYFLAEFQLKGIGVRQDWAQALAGFERLAMRGYVPAQYRLAQLYEVGGQTEFARQWLLTAGGNGHREAMERLVKAYEKGELGIAADNAEAARWRRYLQHRAF